MHQLETRKKSRAPEGIFQLMHKLVMLLFLQKTLWWLDGCIPDMP